MKTTPLQQVLQYFLEHYSPEGPQEAHAVLEDGSVVPLLLEDRQAGLRWLQGRKLRAVVFRLATQGCTGYVWVPELGVPGGRVRLVSGETLEASLQEAHRVWSTGTRLYNRDRAFPERALVTLLEKHDWQYENSDDHSLFVKGDVRMRQIKGLLRGMDNTKARSIWAVYAPLGFPFPGL
jgi:hypothetical protein